LVNHLEKLAEFSNKQQTEVSTPEMKVVEKLLEFISIIRISPFGTKLNDNGFALKIANFVTA
jgi:hypothetical protein